MNVEEGRLRTFLDWPVNVAVDINRIAQAGFYYTGRGLEVTCFSCGCYISDWNYGDQIMTRHRSINPDCAFVRDPGSSGNIPLVTTAAPSVPPQSPNRIRRDRGQAGRWESQTSIYKSENARLESFEGWPIPFIVTPEALAETGFYFLRQGDKVQCAFCNGIVSHWETGDIPEVEHRRHFPACPFLSGNDVGNVPRDNSLPRSSTTERLSVMENFEELGIQRHIGPKHPKYSTVESRLRTFSYWPSDKTQEPIDLAQAGFFYDHIDELNLFRDKVRCFHCDGGLINWDPEDEPWHEHAKWFPTCPYLLLVKGQGFVDEVQGLNSSAAVQVKLVTSSPEDTESAENETSDTKITYPTQEESTPVSVPSISNPRTPDSSEPVPQTQPGSENISLEEENLRLRQARQCKICMDAEVGAVLLPCGHLVTCVECAPILQDCPVCRQQIKATIRTFLS